MAEAADDQVEIPRAQAIDVLRDVNAANHQLHAEVGQVAFEWQQDALELGLCEQELETDRFAGGVEHLVAVDTPSRLLQQLVGAALLLANNAAAIGDRHVEFIGKHLWGDFVAKRFEDFQLGGAGQTAGRQFGVIEIATGTGVGAVE
ncbi:hypothetical protein D9M68_767410 [compost metagenome]